MYIPQWPWGDESFTNIAGYTAVPPLNEALIKGIYKSGPWGEFGTLPNILGWVNEAADPKRTGYVNCSQFTGGTIPEENYKTAKSLLWRPCEGHASATIDAIYKMVSEWGNKVRPIYADDQVKQAKMLEEAWLGIATYADQKIQQSGLTVTPPSMVATPKAAINAITKLRKSGIITESQTKVAVQAVNQGAEPKMWPVILAGAALGWFFLRGR
jgi:hypothetical protein